MDQGMTLIMVALVVLGIACGALFVIIFQRMKGGRSVEKETRELKEREEAEKKKEIQAARTEKIRDFMEFDTVGDDMIIQNDGTRFIMAIKCMGINYDLMSEPEMLAVEEGFSNFLNTLKFPIQLYVQSRTLDLSEGIGVYHKRLNDLREECERYIDAVNQAKATNPNLTMNQRQQMDFEVRKKRNLIEYGTDIVSYIERMSSNTNILQRKYYMIVSYESTEIGLTNNFSKDETKDVAYSELYTRCKTLQAAISACGIETELLRSEDLAELLFIAYNKDDANVYNVKDAIRSGIYRLYSTATSVLDKKRAALDAKLKDDALVAAQTALKTAMDSIRNSSQVDITGLTEEEQYEDDTKREAMSIILDNQDQLDPEVVDKALEDLNSSMHNPLVSQEDLDYADQQFQAEQAQMQENNFGQGIDQDADVGNYNTIANQDPLAGLIN